MRFEFQSVGHIIAPFVVCDTCGNRIFKELPAIAVFWTDDNGDRTGQVSVVHKGRCDTEATKVQPWEDLNSFLRQVSGNADLAVESTRS